MSSPLIDLDAARRLRDGNEPWMTKRELSAALSFSVRWIEYRVQDGMPHKVMGGRVRFQRSVVEEWLEARERRAS